MTSITKRELTAEQLARCAQIADINIGPHRIAATVQAMLEGIAIGRADAGKVEPVGWEHPVATVLINPAGSTEYASFLLTSYGRGKLGEGMHMLHLAAPQQAEPQTGNWIAAEDVLRNVKLLDVALNGPGGATRPLLIDILGQVEGVARKLGKPVLQAITEPTGGMLLTTQARGGT